MVPFFFQVADHLEQVRTTTELFALLFALTVFFDLNYLGAQMNTGGERVEGIEPS